MTIVRRMTVMEEMPAEIFASLSKGCHVVISGESSVPVALYQSTREQVMLQYPLFAYDYANGVAERRRPINWIDHVAGSLGILPSGNRLVVLVEYGGGRIAGQAIAHPMISSSLNGVRVREVYLPPTAEPKGVPA